MDLKEEDRRVNLTGLGRILQDMPRTPTLVTILDGKRMIGFISVDEMISRILMGDNAAEIAKDAGVPPPSINRAFRSETGVGMQKYKGLGRFILGRNKTDEDELSLANMVDKVKNGESPRKIVSEIVIKKVS